MKFKPLGPSLFVAGQIQPEDLTPIAQAGFRLIICNRPDDEEFGQPNAARIEAFAIANGIAFAHIPVSGSISEDAISQMKAVLKGAGGPALAYCRSGSRSAQLGALALAAHVSPEHLVSNASGDLPESAFDIVVVGGGAAGIATAASLLRRRRGLRIAIVEPADRHFYQPGWTLVGAGIFSSAQTGRAMADVIPKGAVWIQARVSSFDPNNNRVHFEDGRSLSYNALVVATGLTLDWSAIPGLEAALGANGVTSNYRVDLAPYTAELVRRMRGGRAIFTQPPMPIKCAGAPQKAMYLSCDEWRRKGSLNGTDVSFHTATPALFGVAAYVPALMRYISRYGINLQLSSKLVAIDGHARLATFESVQEDGTVKRTVEPFDMIHVCPPQVAPAVIASSPLAGAGGFVDVDPATLRHMSYENVFALGDVANTSNAKTAAAARKQAPVVAENVLALLDGTPMRAHYDGYGSCPLTVERGRIVLAEFGYGGTLLPSFPKWLLDGTRPTRLAWFLKQRVLPALYWRGMLKGREWLAAPKPPISPAN